MKNVSYITAGAGSGKTFHLTSELNKAFAEDNIRPSQVILTTFTKMAAGEFKEKVRNAILKNTELVDRIQLAIELDSASISTIHGIALDFIKRYWYLQDLGADIQIMSENNERIYLNQSLAKILTTEELDIINAFNEKFGITESDEDVKTWQKDLNDIIEKMLYYNVVDVEYSRMKSIEEIQKIFCGPKWTDTIVAAYQRLLQKYADLCMGQTTKTAKDRIQCIQEHKDFWNNYADYLEIDKLIKEKTVANYIEKQSDEEKATWNDYAKYAISSSHAPSIINYVNTLFDIAQRWKKEFDGYKKENHILTYNDIELNFYKLLETQEEVRDDIRQRYRLVMVDEFQDCNPIQLKIFNIISELVAENGGRSIWVGDAKQAIYGFRGSDCELVTAVSRQFPNPANGLTTERLTISWRSREPLVQLVNHVFHKIFTSEEIPGHDAETEIRGNKDLVSLKPEYGDDLKGYTAIQHWLFTGKSVNKANVYKGLCHQIKTYIESGLPVKPKKREEDSRDITYKDIAILTDSNLNVSDIVKTFRAQDIPVSTPETNILQRKETKLVMALLEYFIEPSNKHIRADVDYFINGKPTESILEDRLRYIHQLMDDGQQDEWRTKDQWLEDDSFIIRLKELKNKVEKLSISEIVAAVIYELNLPGRIGKWDEEDIRQQNLNTIQDMAKAYDDDCVQLGLGATLTGFLSYLRSTNPEVKADNTSNTVKVMTYHKSKGLEWPVVILDSLNNDFQDINKLIKNEIWGVHQCVNEDSSDIFNRTYRINFIPNLFQNKKIYPQAITDKIDGSSEMNKIVEKCRRERKRLLYVGMTRARDYLISISQKGKDKDEKKGKGKDEVQDKVKNTDMLWLKRLNINSSIISEKSDTLDVWGTNTQELYAQLTTINVDDLATSPAENAVKTYSHIQKPDERTVFTEQYISPSKIKEDATDNDVRLEIIPHVSGRIHLNKTNGQNMDLIGTCIHNIMAVYQPGDEGNAERARLLISNAGLQEVLNDPAVEGILQAAQKLHAYLTEHYGPATTIDKELPFYHQVNGQIVHGEMDLVWNYEADGNPRCVLLDYKTFPGGQNQLESHTRKYIPQLRAYRAALTQGGREVTDCLIYYAVEGSIVKVNI